MTPLKQLTRTLGVFLLAAAASSQTVIITVQAAEFTPSSLQELEQINQAITQIESWLDKANLEHSTYVQQLAEVEKQVNEIGSAAASTRESINQTVSLLTNLNLRIDDLTQYKLEQTELVKNALRAAYMEGSQSYLKLVINLEDPALTARMRHYYQSFNQSRLQQISQYQATLEELAYSEQQLRQDSVTLINERQLLDAQLEELQQLKIARQQALDQLNTTISQRGSELENLIADRAALEELIEQVNRALENIPFPDARVPFAQLKGNLPWPGQGALVNQFGTLYGDGNLQRQGVTITSAEGSSVRAIHGGRVVFTNWLRGSGLLVILDHGDGYMSLYGHNETLTRSKGTWVNAGDTIATAGNSGGQEQTGIYFEIRYNGRPQNPADWIVPRD